MLHKNYNFSKKASDAYGYILADKIYLNKTNLTYLRFGNPLVPQTHRTTADDSAFRGNEIHDGQSRWRAQRYRLLIRYRQKVQRASEIWAKITYTPRCRTGMRYFVKDVMKSLIVLYLVLTELWRIVIVVVTMSDYVCHPLPVTKYYYSRPCFNKRWLIPTSSR